MTSRHTPPSIDGFHLQITATFAILQLGESPGFSIAGPDFLDDHHLTMELNAMAYRWTDAVVGRQPTDRGLCPYSSSEDLHAWSRHNIIRVMLLRVAQVQAMAREIEILSWSGHPKSYTIPDCPQNLLCFSDRMDGHELF